MNPDINFPFDKIPLNAIKMVLIAYHQPLPLKTQMKKKSG